MFVSSRCLFSEEHGQTFVVRRVRIGAGQQGHHMRTSRVGDPCLVARDAVITVFVFHSTGAERTKVRARVRLSEYRSRKNLSRRKFWQPVFLLLLRTTCKDQLSGDFGTSAERTDTNVTTGQFFGDDAHGRFGQAKTTEFFGDSETKDTHFREFFDDLHRDQFVLEVPFMRERLHFFQRVTAELVADHLQFFIQTGCTKHGRTRLILHDLDQAGASRLRVPSTNECNDFWLGKRIRNTEISEAQNFALRHWDAAFDLR